jgi:N-acetyl-anhydromuramyl-L-alanine amidase AmpD
MAEQVQVKDGKLIHSRVADKIDARIEKGALGAVHALVVHQTGAPTSASSFSSYATGQNGAHFLVDTDGSIYQTARITQKCWHVGKIRAKCQEMKACAPDELKAINAILFKKGESYAVRIGALHNHETAKAYPDRYPTNEDSLGIEIVSAFDDKADTYDSVNKSQNDSLAWLVEALEGALALADADVYTHGAIGYKQKSEGSSATWKRP